MTKILHFLYCDEYEADAFFTEDGKIIHAIDNSDATWEGEYMNPFLRKLGFEVEHVCFGEVDTDRRNDFVAQLHSYLGF